MDEASYDENHKLFLWYLDICKNNGWVKQGDNVFEPIKTKMGYKTRAYRLLRPIREMVEMEVTPRQHVGEAWILFRSKGCKRESMTDQLKHCCDPEFPFLKKDRHVFSWDNGVWHCKAYQAGPEVCGDGKMRRLWKQRFFSFQPEAVARADVEVWPARGSAEEKQVVADQKWLANGRFAVVSGDGVFLTGYSISLSSPGLPDAIEEKKKANGPADDKKAGGDEDDEKDDDEDGDEEIKGGDGDGVGGGGGGDEEKKHGGGGLIWISEDDEADFEDDQRSNERPRIWAPPQFYRFADGDAVDLRPGGAVLDQRTAEGLDAESDARGRSEDQKRRQVRVFRNGVFVAADHRKRLIDGTYAWVGRFYPFRADMEDLPADIIAAKYSPLVFEYQEYERIIEHFADPMKIPTDAAQSLIDHQFRLREEDKKELRESVRDDCKHTKHITDEVAIQKAIQEAEDEKEQEWHDVSRFKYASTCRLIYEVRELDRWEYQVLDRGLAGVGKSTWMKMPEEFYEETDITIVGNDAEKNFPIQVLPPPPLPHPPAALPPRPDSPCHSWRPLLEPSSVPALPACLVQLCWRSVGGGSPWWRAIVSCLDLPLVLGAQDIWLNKTFLYLLPEVKRDLALPPTTWQCMVSGDGVQVKMKNLTAVTIAHWTTPGMMAGNDAPTSWPNDQDQIGRRLPTFEHNRTVWKQNTELPFAMSFQKPAFMCKGVMLYFLYIRQYGHLGLWKWIPQYFHGTKANLRQESNALEAFLLKGNKLKFGAGERCSLESFNEEFDVFCDKKNWKRRRLTPGFYNPVFQRRDLKVLTGVFQKVLGDVGESRPVAVPHSRSSRFARLHWVSSAHLHWLDSLTHFPAFGVMPFFWASGSEEYGEWVSHPLPPIANVLLVLLVSPWVVFSSVTTCLPPQPSCCFPAVLLLAGATQSTRCVVVVVVLQIRGCSLKTDKPPEDGDPGGAAGDEDVAAVDDAAVAAVEDAPMGDAEGDGGVLSTSSSSSSSAMAVVDGE